MKIFLGFLRLISLYKIFLIKKCVPSKPLLVLYCQLLFQDFGVNSLLHYQHHMSWES